MLKDFESALDNSPTRKLSKKKLRSINRHKHLPTHSSAVIIKYVNGRELKPKEVCEIYKVSKKKISSVIYWLKDKYEPSIYYFYCIFRIYKITGFIPTR